MYVCMYWDIDKENNHIFLGKELLLLSHTHTYRKQKIFDRIILSN